MLNIQRVNNIVCEKVGNNKYKLSEPIQVLPIKTYLTEEELEMLYKVFDNGFKIKLESENEDKKIENIGTIYFSETPTEAILHRKIEEIIDYINGSDK